MATKKPLKKPATPAPKKPAKNPPKKVTKAEAEESEPVEVERELLEITGIKGRGKKESREEYLLRLGEAVSELEEEEYGELSDAAQKWFAAAAKKINADKVSEVAPFPEEGNGVETEEEEAPAKAAKGKKVPTDRPTKAPRQHSGADTLRHIIADDTDITKEAAEKAFKKAGGQLASSQFNLVFTTAKRMVDVLKQRGMLS